MGFWELFLLWGTLCVLAIIALTFIGRSLYLRALEVVHQLERMSKKVESLTSALSEPSGYQGPANNLEDNPVVLVRKRAVLLATKAKKRADRQRRLIKSLNSFNPDESRFR